MKKTILDSIYEIHKNQLKNLPFPHKKLFICFSGVPGSGKTYVAKKIEERYKAVRVNNDDIREIIRKIVEKSKNNVDVNEIEQLLDKYLINFLNNYTFPNKTIILDSGIERRSDKIKKLAKNLGFKIFLIKMISSRKNCEKGVIKKLGKLDENFMNNISRWIKENKEFNKSHKANFEIKNYCNIKLNLEGLFAKLNEFIL